MFVYLQKMIYLVKVSFSRLTLYNVLKKFRVVVFLLALFWPTYEMDLIDYYNLIIEGECTIIDVRTNEQFLSQHIKTAKYVDQDSPDTYTSLTLKRKVLICYEDQYPQQQMIDFISRMKGVEEVVCLHFPDLSREYPFLCQNSYDNTSSSLELYPTRLLFKIHFLFIFFVLYRDKYEIIYVWSISSC